MIEKIAHVGIAVRDLEAALGFYQAGLGLTLTRLEDLSQQGVRAALLSLGESELELLEPLNAESGVARFLERRGDGMHHLALGTLNIHEALAHVKAKGVELVDQAPRRGINGLVFFIHPRSLQGVLVELEEGDAAAGDKRLPPGGEFMRLEGVIVSVADPREAAALWGDVFGLATPDKSWTGVPSLAAGNAFIGFVPSAGVAGLQLEVDDLEGVLTRLRERGMAVSGTRLEKGIAFAAVGASSACGVSIRLKERVE